MKDVTWYESDRNCCLYFLSVSDAVRIRIGTAEIAIRTNGSRDAQAA